MAQNLNAAGPRAVEQNPGRERVRDGLRVRAAEGGMKERDRSAAAHSVAPPELIEADAVLLLAIEVRVAGMARFDSRLHEGVYERISRPSVADGQRAELRSP